MTIEAVWKPLGVGALAVVAAACSEPRGSAPTAARHSLRADSLVWAEEQKVVANDAAELDELGYSVSLTTDRALIGAYGESSFRGAAYVFVKSGSSWIQEQKLVASDGAEGEKFGWSVSLSGDHAVVGAYGEESYRGAAYVFVRSGSSWIEEQKLVASDRAEFDQFGNSVSLAADRALVGAPGNDSYRGAAFVFVKSGSSWTEEQKLVASHGVADDDFGSSVSLAADRALVGAPGNDGYRGAAYVFVKSGSSWTEEQELVASDGAELEQLGNSVSLAADRALVGAYWDNDLRGAAYVFVRSGSSWTEEQKLVASDRATGDRFGNSISLGPDRALIGAFGSESTRGAAYVFVRSVGSWTEEQRLVASDGESFDLFAWSVSLAADHALVGANYADQQRGAAYVFSLGLTNGGPCSADADCASGHCVDDRCCNIDCAGACGACSIAEGATADGICTVSSSGSEGSPPCGILACNGQSPACGPCQSDKDCPEARQCAADGTCQPRREQGAACDDRAGADRPDCLVPGCRLCRSGFCADGVCCDTACDGLCEACTARLKGNGDDGHCGPTEAGTDPEDACGDDGAATCEANGLCDGAGGCQRYHSRTGCEPEPCTRGHECTSGHCEDEICCDRACAPSERCRADLKVSGADGTCGPSRAAELGAPCKFDVQCTSGHCNDGACVSAPGASAPGDDTSCTCRAGGSPRHTPGSWLAVALGLLLFLRRRERSASGAYGLGER